MSGERELQGVKEDWRKEVAELQRQLSQGPTPLDDCSEEHIYEEPPEVMLLYRIARHFSWVRPLILSPSINYTCNLVFNMCFFGALHSYFPNPLNPRITVSRCCSPLRTQCMHIPIIYRVICSQISTPCSFSCRQFCSIMHTPFIIVLHEFRVICSQVSTPCPPPPLLFLLSPVLLARQIWTAPNPSCPCWREALSSSRTALTTLKRNEFNSQLSQAPPRGRNARS